MKKLICALAAATAVCLTFTACSAADPWWDYPSYDYADDSYVYDKITEIGFKEVADEPSSHFSLDANTACYSLVRRQIESGYKVSPTSVRIEELLNYFDYSYPAPENGEAVKVSGYLSDCPWNSESKLMLAGVKTEEKNLGDVNGNYVFLIDVSGSMSGDNRLGLAKEGLKYLVDNLTDNDTVSIVTYASGIRKVLDGAECSAENKNNIKNAISALRTGGATNGRGGLELAYETCANHYITGGNNRVILISDGDFNVGINSPEALKEIIREKASKSGIYLSVFGVGMGNMRDDILETLATCGNGNYAHLDNLTEARKVFGEKLNGTLMTVAKDAKAGVTFTENVLKYRLIGYDAKLMNEEDFNDENKDAGEIGSNLCVTALYEVQLRDDAAGKLADVEIRYKDATDGETSKNAVCTVDTATPTCADLSFISCVAEFGLLLRESAYKGTASFEALLSRLEDLREYTAADTYKTEFVALAGRASEIYSDAAN